MPEEPLRSVPLAARRERLVKLTHELIEYPSTVSNPSARMSCAAHLKQLLDEVECVELIEYDDSEFPSFLAAPRGCPEPEVLLIAHLDVVEHENVGAYRAMVRDGRIIGCGAGDMKGQLAICVEVFKSLLRDRPERSLGLLVTSDEETGGQEGVRRVFEEKGLRCELAIIPDGACIDQLTVEEKGIIQLELSNARGSGSAHASRPWLTTNPLADLVEDLHRILAAFETLGDRSAGPEDEETAHWYPTCVPTLISTPNRSLNRIPHDAKAGLDVRFPPPYCVEDLVSLARQQLSPNSELRVIVSAEPTHLDPDPRFERIGEQVLGRPMRRIRASGGSDARFVALHGIPVILSRPLVGKVHAHDEWIDIESMLVFGEILERYLIDRLG